MTESASRQSDLGVRVLSAVAMVAIAGLALWVGGAWWAAFVAIIAAGVLWEWFRLARAIAPSFIGRLLWAVGGLLYIGVAAVVLIQARAPFDGILHVGQLLAAAIGVDVGAYFAGRTIGGPKIAPSISPSKTWAGLFGGAIGAALLLAIASWTWSTGLCEAYIESLNEPPPPPGYAFADDRCHLWVTSISDLWTSGFILAGGLAAIIAQSGDFFESWMKRRAGVKDSGNLIPGHGGLFDRVDGLVAVSFVIGVLVIVGRLRSGLG